jgi:hypothetical protein
VHLSTEGLKLKYADLAELKKSLNFSLYGKPEGD